MPTAFHALEEEEGAGPGGHPPSLTGGVGKQCSPRGPVSSEVTKAQRAHWELCSLKCSWGREVLSTPQDLPSACDPLGPSRSASDPTPPAPVWGSDVGWPQVTRPTDSPSSRSVGLPRPAAGARSTGHRHPPPTRRQQDRRSMETKGVLLCPDPVP